jgi:hypothetical protein
MIYQWYEVWADETHDTPYLLFLCPSPQEPGKFVIIDPKENNSVIEVLPNYDSATTWLVDDEFTLVVGRMHNE